MELTQLTVQLWLEDLAERTLGEYTVKYSKNTAIHKVHNEHGEVRFTVDNNTKKWFHHEPSLVRVTEADEFIRILNEIDK